MNLRNVVSAIGMVTLVFVSMSVALQAQTLKDQWDKSSTLLEQGKFKEALAILSSMQQDTALSSQMRPGVLFRIAYSHSGLGDDAMAVVKWKEFLELLPENGVGWANMGWSQYLTGDIQGAIKSTTKSLEYDKTLSFAKANLGLYYLDLGKKTEAMAVYDEAITMVKPGDSIDGPLEDLKNLEKKKPELKDVIAGLRQRFNKAAAEGAESTQE